MYSIASLLEWGFGMHERYIIYIYVDAECCVKGGCGKKVTKSNEALECMG